MKIAVYCASSMGKGHIYRDMAATLGRWLGRNGHTLIYGGGDAGLMGVVAQAAYESGSHVIGVLPGNVSFICDRPQPWCTEVLTESDMSARKQRMLELADAFFALPGGTGTLDEMTEVITLTKIGVFRKPSVLIDVDGFYSPFRLMLDRMTETGFIGPGEMEHVLFSDDLTEIDGFLKSYFAEADSHE